FGRVLWRSIVAFLSLSPMATAGVATFVLLAERRTIRRAAAHVGAAIGLLLVGVVVQGRLYAYHFGAPLLLWSLVGGWGLWLLWLRVRARAVGAAAYVALLLALAGLSGSRLDLGQTFWARCRLRAMAWMQPDRREAIRDELYSVLDYRARDNRM